jgi:hypothetical protein
MHTSNHTCAHCCRIQDGSALPHAHLLHSYCPRSLLHLSILSMSRAGGYAHPN